MLNEWVLETFGHEKIRSEYAAEGRSLDFVDAVNEVVLLAALFQS